MDPSFRTASPSEPVERAVARLRECHCSSMPVMSDGQLAGVLTSDNIAEFVMIATALRSSNGESKASVPRREKP